MQSRRGAAKVGTAPPVRNFGRNIEVCPRHLYRPAGEIALLEILEAHRSGKIRAVGSGHAWSPGIACEDVLLDMSSFNHIELVQRAEGPEVRAGGGATVKDILRFLTPRGMTLPSIGLIAEQTIAGATATGTHGSGRHSLSHYVTEVRVACFGGEGGSPEMRCIRHGQALRAARCALGCLGVVTEVSVRCVPQYDLEEQSQWAESLEQVLA
ncbi:MAG: FAD-binding protein, partial [Gemmatimonadota bacterium]|nr:FAD-binding protein [Gemmatimonadota bacterium]